MDLNALRTTYAGLDSTVDALLSIGFVLDRNAPRPGSLITASDIPPTFRHSDDSNVIAAVYRCGLGYYCVSLYVRSDCEDVQWQAPVIWDGPTAPWDKTTSSDVTAEFRGVVEELIEIGE